MGRIIFVNRFYWPETTATAQLLTDLAIAMAAGEHQVSVITSRAATSNAPSHQSSEGVEIFRVRTPRLAESVIAGKALAFASFFIGAAIRLLRQLKRNDTVVVMTDPPLFGIAAWLIARSKGAKLIHWIQDIYPEVATAVTGQRWLRVFVPCRNEAWRAAYRCVTVGSQMAETIARTGVRPAAIVTIPNWAPKGLTAMDPENPAVIALRRAWSLEGKFVVTYSGNLGRVHNLNPVIAAAARLHAEPNIVFLFIGGGAQRDALVAETTKRRLANVKFLPSQPRDQLGLALAVGDVHLVTLRAGCESLVFPSKLYGIAAAARPILFVGPQESEIAKLVLQNELGRSIDDNYPDQLAECIRKFACNPVAVRQCGRAAAKFAESHSAATAVSRWDSLFDELNAC